MNNFINQLLQPQWYSTNGASIAKAGDTGLIKKDIANPASWSNGSRFSKYYKLPVQKKFGANILQVYEHSH